MACKDWMFHAYKIVTGTPKKDSLEDPEVYGKIILKWNSTLYN